MDHSRFFTYQPSTYAHVQRGPWAYVLFVVGFAAFIGGMLTWDQPPAPWILVPVGVLQVFLGFCFLHLTVTDRGDHLLVQFGPLPLFWTRVRYESLQSVDLGKTSLLDGWGIHMSLRGGWVWNIWGWDCVVVRHPGTLHIGSDDAENLAAFLRTKVQSER